MVLCIPQISTTGEITCMTNSFIDAGITTTEGLTIEVLINGQDANAVQALTTTTRNEFQSTSTVTPSSVSPVMKTNVTIQLDATFPYTLAKEDFSVNATSTSNSSYIR